ncbi:glycosyltransferase involved in cell wall biosynthesis [Chryseobacterium sp. H1D6B]|uniref:glycosyltransferase family 4 protein n=1 Tax=Chryseobacterium sp. H1D6B TaxID=2940588 RepID=UPI0015CC4E0A|nr:glycosyltransferase family 4 protein [Chryseobacterium sp. H1D6B]MDH6251207.1 glycosyltransferase involved in cell wall biosynthesis [Chryseobacterium sp. H1D6B]
MKYSDKKLLFFFQDNPFAKGAGNIARAYSNMKHLKSLGFQIDLVGVEDLYKNFGDPYEHIDRNMINDFLILSRRPPKHLLSFTYWKYKIIKLFSKKNKSNIFYTQYFKDSFSTFFKARTYDYIFINYEFWTDLINTKDLKGAKTIIDTHDWMTLNEFYKNKKLDIGKKFGQEIKNLSFYDKVITVSSDEHFIFKGFLGDKVINIPPNFPENFISENTSKKYDLIFVGSDNPFNILSLNWFIDKVHPLLSEKIKICVIGKVCNHIPDRENIEKHVFVADLAEFYHHSKIAICPMLEGTGIKIKVVEALSFGLPVVGTEKALDGFTQKSKNGCLVSDDEKKFAENIVLLLNNSELYEEQKKEAVDFFINNFSEKKAIELLESIL